MLGWVACWVLWINSIQLYRVPCRGRARGAGRPGPGCPVVILFGFLWQTGGFVVWEPHSERVHAFIFIGFVCVSSCRPISTGQLHESLVLASTSGLSTQWSGWGPPARDVHGNLILKRASRLDAFSGYPIRT